MDSKEFDQVYKEYKEQANFKSMGETDPGKEKIVAVRKMMMGTLLHLKQIAEGNWITWLLWTMQKRGS